MNATGLVPHEDAAAAGDASCGRHDSEEDWQKQTSVVG